MNKFLITAIACSATFLFANVHADNHSVICSAQAKSKQQQVNKCCGTWNKKASVSIDNNLQTNEAGICSVVCPNRDKVTFKWLSAAPMKGSFCDKEKNCDKGDIIACILDGD